VDGREELEWGLDIPDDVERQKKVLVWPIS